MKHKLAEETVIFIGIIRWIVLAAGIGILIGAATALFLKGLSWGIATASAHPWYFYLLPVGLFLSALLVRYGAPDAEGHGTEKVIEAVHKRWGKIKARVVPVKAVATIITISSGGSVGKEGPSAQIGSGIASVVADILKFTRENRRKLVICGISAGFATVFGTPIAGAIFGVEVLFVGNILYDVLLPSFVAGIVAYHTAVLLGMTYPSYAIATPDFSNTFLLKVALAGIFIGLCAFLVIEILKYQDRLGKKVKVWAPLRAAIGGLILVGLALAFSTAYLGLGTETIQSALRGDHIVWYAFLLKAIFTGFTLGFGGSGGIITPLFFMGAAAGSLFGSLLGQHQAAFAAIGFVALVAGAANTPIAASIMALELFGMGIAPYAALACVIAYLMTGHRSVYPSQILAQKKSADLPTAVGVEMEHVEASVGFKDVNVMLKDMGRTPGVFFEDITSLLKRLKKPPKKKR